MKSCHFIEELLMEGTEQILNKKLKHELLASDSNYSFTSSEVLPRDVMVFLLQTFLDPKEIAKCSRVCKHWMRLLESDAFVDYWKSYYKSFGFSIGIQIYLKNFTWVRLIGNAWKRQQKIDEKSQHLQSVAKEKGFTLHDPLSHWVLKHSTSLTHPPPEWKHFVTTVSDGIGDYQTHVNFHIVPALQHGPETLVLEDVKLKDCEADVAEVRDGSIVLADKYLFLNSVWRTFHYLAWSGMHKGTVWVYEPRTFFKYRGPTKFLDWMKEEMTVNSWMYEYV